MALLTEKGKQRYALATGKVFIGICDRKACRKLIPVTDMYIVLEWEPRNDKLTFLGATPKRIICKACQDLLHPIPVVKKKEEGPSKGLKSAFTRYFEKHPDIGITTKMFVLKMQRKKKFSKLMHREIVKVLKVLKKEKVLIYQKKNWKLRKHKVV